MSAFRRAGSRRERSNAIEMSARMKEKTEKKGSIWNRLFILAVIIVAGLIALFFFLRYKQESVLMIDRPFEAALMPEGTYTHAKTFASGLARSDASVVCEGVELDATTEKALTADLDSKKMIFAQGIYDKAYPASLTKLMTAILALEYGNMDETVIISEEDLNLEEGSQVSGLSAGDRLTMRELFNSLVVYSANDAAMAIARTVDGSVSKFVDHMNEKALQLGMIQTHFTNPSGLHDPENYTCAYDVYLMMNEAIRYQAFTDAMRLNVYHLSVPRDDMVIVYDLSSTDKYMTGDEPLPPGVTILAGKTGTTDEAGSCLCLAVQNIKGQPFIAIVLNAYDKAVLYKDMGQLLKHIND